MHRTFVRLICQVLAVALFVLPIQAAHAGMIGSGQSAVVHAGAGADAERSQLSSMLARAGLADQLQAMGVEPQSVRDRVAAMTDAEARDLAGRLGTLPAGAAEPMLALFLAAAILVWYFFGLREQK